MPFYDLSVSFTIYPSPVSVFNIHNHLGVMLLTRLRVGFSHLREHKFRHNFIDTVDPFCSCRTNSIETTEHYLLQCPNFLHLRYKLFDNLHRNGISVMPYNGCYLTSILLFGHPSFNSGTNRNILTNTINFIIETKRFNDPLFS